MAVVSEQNFLLPEFRASCGRHMDRFVEMPGPDTNQGEVRVISPEKRLPS